MNTPFSPFWSPPTWTVPMRALLDAVLLAHHLSAQRENVSTQVVKAAVFGSGDYYKALAAGLLTLGGIHAPLSQTYNLLNRRDTAARATELLDKEKKVPGWGGSFHPGAADPLWTEVDGLLAAEFPVLHERLVAVSAVLRLRGKALFPNPSAYTALTGLALRLPQPCIGWLFVQGRLAAWSSFVLESYQTKSLHHPNH